MMKKPNIAAINRWLKLAQFGVMVAAALLIGAGLVMRWAMMGGFALATLGVIIAGDVLMIRHADRKRCMPPTFVVMTIVMVMLVGGPFSGWAIASVFGMVVGIGVGAWVSLSIGAWLFLRLHRMDLLIYSRPPTAVRVVSVIDSTWTRHGGPMFQVRLVQDDGRALGEHTIAPPPHSLERIEAGDRLVVQWHANYPWRLEVDWGASGELPEYEGYRR